MFLYIYTQPRERENASSRDLIRFTPQKKKKRAAGDRTLLAAPATAATEDTADPDVDVLVLAMLFITAVPEVDPEAAEVLFDDEVPFQPAAVPFEEPGGPPAPLISPPCSPSIPLLSFSTPPSAVRVAAAVPVYAAVESTPMLIQAKIPSATVSPRRT